MQNALNMTKYLEAYSRLHSRVIQIILILTTIQVALILVTTLVIISRANPRTISSSLVELARTSHSSAQAGKEGAGSGRTAPDPFEGMGKPTLLNPVESAFLTEQELKKMRSVGVR